MTRESVPKEPGVRCPECGGPGRWNIVEDIAVPCESCMAAIDDGYDIDEPEPPHACEEHLRACPACGEEICQICFDRCGER